MRTIAKNTGLLFLNEITMILLSLIFVAVIARKLGDTGYGKYSFAIGFTSIFAVLADFGLNNLAFRDLAREKTKCAKYLGNIIVIKLFLSVAVFLAIVIGIRLMHPPRETRLVVYFIGAYMLLSAFTQLLRFTFYAFEKMEYGVMVMVVDKLLIIVFGILVLLIRPGVVAFSATFVLVGLSTFLFAFWVGTRNFGIPALEMDLKFWVYLFKAAFPLGLMIVFTMLYQRVNISILSANKGDAVTGWYSAAFNLFSQAAIISTAFVTSVYPRLSNLAVSAPDSLETIYRRCLRYLFALALPMSVGLFILADKIILFIYGKEFVESVLLLKILSLALAFSFTNILLWTVLSSMNKQAVSAFCLGLTVIVLAILDVLLIPRWSYTGATIAQVGAEIFLFAASFSFVTKYLGFIFLPGLMVKPGVASLGMGVMVYVFRNVHLLIIVPLAAVFYIALFLTIKGLSKEEIQLLKKLFLRRPVEKGTTGENIIS